MTAATEVLADVGDMCACCLLSDCSEQRSVHEQLRSLAAVCPLAWEAAAQLREFLSVLLSQRVLLARRGQPVRGPWVLLVHYGVS